jgi:hypothetical protein
MGKLYITTLYCSINLIGEGVMTLNGLTNSYTSPPSSAWGNPPSCMPIIGQGLNTNAIQSAGQYLEGSTCGFGNTITYNLPDGSLLTISFNVGYVTNSTSTYSAEVSEGSLFEVVNVVTPSSDPATNSTLNFSFTVQMQK